MTPAKQKQFLLLLLPFVIFTPVLLLPPQAAADPSHPPLNPTPTPTPTPWPPQFHALLYGNYSGALSIYDLWYDWPKGRNLNIKQNQLGELIYDLEWNNGTSFYYTLDSSRECKMVYIGFGILRPNWLEGAQYLGQERVDGFLCNVWTKVDFIWYYEDVDTKRPVHWRFYTGRAIHVMTFEVGAVLEDAKCQAPAYCFEKDGKSSELLRDVLDNSQDNGALKKLQKVSI